MMAMGMGMGNEQLQKKNKEEEPFFEGCEPQELKSIMIHMIHDTHTYMMRMKTN